MSKQVAGDACRVGRGRGGLSVGGVETDGPAVNCRERLHIQVRQPSGISPITVH